MRSISREGTVRASHCLPMDMDCGPLSTSLGPSPRGTEVSRARNSTGTAWGAAKPCKADCSSLMFPAAFTIKKTCAEAADEPCENEKREECTESRSLLSIHSHPQIHKQLSSYPFQKMCFPFSVSQLLLKTLSNPVVFLKHILHFIGEKK